MLRYTIKRVLFVIPVMLGVILIVFLLSALTPSDAVDQMYEGATEEFKIAKRAELGLDKPLLVRYVNYVVGLVTRGDLGTSYKTGQSVTSELISRFPVTLILSFAAVALGVIAGIPLGVVAAVKQYSWIDSLILVISIVSASMPAFWLALMLVVLFSVNLQWLPVSGIIDPKGWILPILVVGVSCLSSIVRITRSSMLEVIRQDYIRTAEAKGQKQSVITIKHALRNALIPVITNIGGQLSMQLGGALIIENVFSMPGIGKYMVEAINARNFPVVQGGVVLLAFVYTMINLLIDVSYAFVDPRLKTSMMAKKPKKHRAKATVVEGGAIHG